AAKLRTVNVAPVSCSPVHTTAPSRKPTRRLPVGSSASSAPLPQAPPCSERGTSCTPWVLQAPGSSFVKPLIGKLLMIEELPPQSRTPQWSVRAAGQTLAPKSGTTIAGWGRPLQAAMPTARIARHANRDVKRLGMIHVIGVRTPDLVPEIRVAPTPGL